MREIIFSLPRNLRRSFSLAAKESFPNETFAFCLGNKRDNIYEVEYLFYPKILLNDDGLGFIIPNESQLWADKLARDSNTEVISSVHSHPYPNQTCSPLGAAPSEVDWDYNIPNIPMGICEVYEVKKKLHSRFRFWAPLPSLILTT